jgi:integrase
MLGYTKKRRRDEAAMHERTRTLAPALDVLTDSTYHQHRRAQRLVAAAAGIPPGGTFTFDDLLYERPTLRDSALGASHRPIRIRLVGTGIRTFEVAKREQDTFWAWAAVEILRLTGIRLEELLELTHFSIQPYVQPDGTKIPLLHIAPSKTDTERLIPCAPELATVLAAVIRRAKNGQPHIPVLRRWDPHERQLAAPLPLLMQRQSPSGPTPLTPSYIYALLQRALDSAALTGIDGQPLRFNFAPHDFRRIFATDAVRSGLPLHIAARILGHPNLETTRGYVAVYNDDVMQAYLDFIQRRRDHRPSAERRPATGAEWDDYKRRFAERKMSLGTCERGYGTPCIHEHACERCTFLRPDPTQRPRLQHMRENVDTRIAEAEQHGWLGELRGLQLSARAIAQKIDDVDRILGLVEADPAGERLV